MAGTLREFTMPNPALAKKRERSADVQDELWQKMGVDPVEVVEGKVEDEKAVESLNLLEKTQKSQESGKAELEDVEQAKEAFIKAAKQAIQTKDPPMEEAVKKTIEFGQNLVELAASYLTQFVGMVAGRLADRDTRKYYKWNRTSLLNIEGVNTIEDLVRKNYHLGKPILTVLVEQYDYFIPKTVKKEEEEEEEEDLSEFIHKQTPGGKGVNEFIGPLYDVFRMHKVRSTDPTTRRAERELDRLLENADNVGFPTEEKRQWLFNVLDLAAFQFLLGDSTLGAMTMALGQIKRIPGCERFELKQLILSEGVRDIFAIFVAFQYLMSSGGNAYAGRSSQMGNAKGTTYMLSAGLETRKMLYAQIETAQYWFQDVYEIENPTLTYLKKEHTKLNKDLESLNYKEPINNRSAYIDWEKVLASRRSKWSITKNRQILERRITKEKYSDPVKDYMEKQLQIFRIEEILPDIAPKLLQHAN